MRDRPTEVESDEEPKSSRKITRRTRLRAWLSLLLAFSIFYALLPAVLPRRGLHEAIMAGDYTAVRLYLIRHPKWASRTDGDREYALELVSLPPLGWFDPQMEEYKRPRDAGETRERIARVLLDCGAARGPGWESAVQGAILGNWPRTLMVFLQREGTRISNDERTWFLRWALICETPEILQLLLDYDPAVGADQATALLSSFIPPEKGWKTPCYGTPEAIVQVLLNHGANANAPGLFHRAVSRCDEAVIAEIISHAADVKACDDAGRTPLHIAALRGDRALMKLLVSHGASEDAKDCNGKTPEDLFAAKPREP